MPKYLFFKTLEKETLLVFSRILYTIEGVKCKAEN
jgi:hypothetical protein